MTVSAGPGVAQFVFSQHQTLSSPLPFPNDTSRFGRSLAWVDLDGDGRDDLAAIYRDSPSNTHRVVAFQATEAGLELLPQFAVFSATPIVAGCDLDPTTPGEELIVGMPAADVSFNGTVAGAGAVFVYQWTGSTNPTLLAQWSQADVPGATPEPGDDFGAALATGDFDGDGQCDVAIGSPEEDLDGTNNVGALVVRYGPLATGNWSDEFGADDLVMNTLVAAGDRFGQVLAAGNLDASPADELVVGVPDADGTGLNVGVVWVLYANGRGSGIPFDAERIDLGSIGLVEEPRSGFGSALAIGDFDGDGVGDLAASAAGYPLGTSLAESGIVAVIPGTPFGTVQVDQAEAVSIEDAGLSANHGDEFGAALAVARVYGGIARDLVVSAPGVGEGGLIAVFRGDEQLALAESIEQDDLGSDAEMDAFGEVLAFGDADGDGSPELAIAAPQENVEGRGSSPGDRLGIVHVVPTVSYLRPAEIVATVGQSYLGQAEVLAIDVPQHNGAGQAAFRVRVNAPEELAATTEQIIASSGTLSSQVGIDQQGNVAWVDLEDGELVVSSRGVVFEDGLPAPGGGLFDFAASDRLLLRGIEQLFFLTELQAPLQRVILRVDLATASTTRLLAEGDEVAGRVVDEIVDVAASPGGGHWMASIRFTEGPGLILDGALLGGATARGNGSLEFVDIGVDDEGSAWAALQSGDATFGAVGHVLGSTVLLQEGAVGNVPLAGRVPHSVGVSGAGDALSVWGSPGGGGEIVALTCASPEIVAREQEVPIAGLPGAEGGVFQSVIGVRVLAAGDRLDTDDDGLADMTVVGIDGEVGGAPEVSDAGRIVMRLAVREDASPDVVREALVRLPAPVCPFFRDGFESGDLGAWSSAVP